MYAMTHTCPDDLYDLSIVSRYQENPSESQWTTMKKIIKYFRNTKDMFLVYDGKNEIRVTRYSDVSFQIDRQDSCS